MRQRPDVGPHRKVLRKVNLAPGNRGKLETGENAIPETPVSMTLPIAHHAATVAHGRVGNWKGLLNRRAVGRVNDRRTVESCKGLVWDEGSISYAQAAKA